MATSQLDELRKLAEEALEFLSVAAHGDRFAGDSAPIALVGAEPRAERRVSLI